jgi:niacin transporter
LRSIDVAMAALFSSLALVIPLFFKGTLQIVIPTIGYSATLGSHVPVMLSVIFGPLVASIVGAASTLGFLATLGPVVGARAATHIIWGVAAAFAVKKGMSFPKALFLVALPIHAILEGIVVIPFGIPWQGALINIVGTAIHHIIDSIISILVQKAALPLIRTLKKRL